VLILAVVAVSAGATMAMQPAAATDVCGPWYTDQDIANETLQAGCRDTYVVDVGAGNHLSREQLLAAGAFYDSQGFDRQFRWYAPMTTVHVADTSEQLWTGCNGHSPRLPGGACSDPIKTDPMYHGGALKASSIDILAFAWDGGVIARACGNYFVPKDHMNPVPSVAVEKYDDRNRNGVRDPGENDLSGWEFKVVRVASKYNDQGTGEVGTVTTDGSGSARFFFDGQGPGTYTVQEVPQAGWASTTADPQTVVVEDGIGDAEVAHLQFGNAQTRADLAKVGFGLVNPPSRLDAHVPVDLTVRATVRNNGPADVAAVDSIDVTVPEDCVAEPAHDEATRVLAAGQEAVIEFTVRVRCEKPSYHPMTFTDHLAVATAGIEDPVQENNTKAFQHVFEVYDRADIQLSGTAVHCPARSDINQAFACSVTADVVNAGPYGPATADVAFAVQVPADCTAVNVDGMPTQTLSLPVGEPQTVVSQWQVTCTHRSFHDIGATAQARLNHLHLEDLVGGNENGTATTRLGIFEPADLVAVGIDVRCTERESNTLSSDCTATFKVRNDGPATGVAVLTTLSITTEADCSATPAAPQTTTFVLDAGSTRDVVATWHLTCAQTYRHSVRVTGTIAADEPHAEDRGPGLNTATTVWGPSDVKPRSLPSSINIGKEGVIPFALLSTPTLNTLTQIDRSSVRLAGAVATCATVGEDVNDDGRLDLICRVNTPETTLTCGTTVALVTGKLTDGTPYQSEDTVKITGCK
jgi:Prealbumin-like fold domain